MKPYYQDDWTTIYCGDCLKIVPLLEENIDLILTDPVYPKLDYGWKQSSIIELANFWKNSRQFYFWMNLEDFPLDFSAIHIWVKPNVYLGGATQYERIF